MCPRQSFSSVSLSVFFFGIEEREKAGQTKDEAKFRRVEGCLLESVEELLGLVVLRVVVSLDDLTSLFDRSQVHRGGQEERKRRDLNK